MMNSSDEWNFVGCYYLFLLLKNTKNKKLMVWYYTYEMDQYKSLQNMCKFLVAKKHIKWQKIQEILVKRV